MVIPSVFGIDISDIEIHFNEGWAEAGISVSPAFWLRAQQIFKAISEEAFKIRGGAYSIKKTHRCELNEAYNALGPNQCSTDAECAGERICSTAGWCSGESRCESDDALFIQ